MTTSNEVAYAVNILAGLLLIFRLARLSLHRVYRVFSAYLWFNSATWFLFYVLVFFFPEYIKGPNYTIFWFATQLGPWTFYMWMAYELLEAVLLRLPGLLKFSRRLMLAMFVIATVISLLTVQNEYAAGGVKGLEGIGLVLDRAISSTVLIVLLSVLGFLLRFPIEIPRNLAAFSLSFVFFFGFNTMVDLARAYLSNNQGAGVNVDRFLLLTLIGIWLQSGCFVFLALFLSRGGEKIPVSLRPQPNPRDRERLIGQLEALNAALLRSARHKS